MATQADRRAPGGGGQSAGVPRRPDAGGPPAGRGGLPAPARGGCRRRARPDAGRGPAGLGQRRTGAPGGTGGRAAGAEAATGARQPRRRVPGRPGDAGHRPPATGRHAPRPVSPAAPRCAPPGAGGAAVPGAEAQPDATASAPEASGGERAEQPGDAGRGARLPPGGGETARPSAGPVDRAAPRLVPGHARAEAEGATVAHAPVDRGGRCGAADTSPPRSRPTMTPGGSSRGKRRAGTRHEPCDRADRGRAFTPHLFRLYTRRTGKPSTGGRTPGDRRGSGLITASCPMKFGPTRNGAAANATNLTSPAVTLEAESQFPESRMR